MGARFTVKHLSWTGIILLSGALILVAALAGVLLAGLFPQASPIFLLPTSIAIGVIVRMAVKKNLQESP